MLLLQLSLIITSIVVIASVIWPTFLIGQKPKISIVSLQCHTEAQRTKRPSKAGGKLRMFPSKREWLPLTCTWEGRHSFTWHAKPLMTSVTRDISDCITLDNSTLNKSLYFRSASELLTLVRWPCMFVRVCFRSCRLLRLTCSGRGQLYLWE